MIEFAPKPKNKMTYDEALLYCQFLEYNGHKDWRLPTLDEYYNTKYLHMTNGWYIDGYDNILRHMQVFPVRDVC